MKTCIKTGNIRQCTDLLTMKTMDLEKRDEDGNTYLNMAAQSGWAEICKMLILDGAVINTQNDLGNTPLHHAYSYRVDEVLRVLIYYGADQNIKNNLGRTPWEGL
jgi:ankyrin repeat protein